MRVIVLVHSDLIPPEEVANPSDIEFKPWVTEFDVIQELKNSPCRQSCRFRFQFGCFKT